MSSTCCVNGLCELRHVLSLAQLVNCQSKGGGGEEELREEEKVSPRIFHFILEVHFSP